MKIVENTASRLVVEAGVSVNPTVCTFDKDANTALIVQQSMFWRRPVRRNLDEVDTIAVQEVFSSADGRPSYVPVVRFTDGETIPLSEIYEEDAADTAERMRRFLE